MGFASRSIGVCPLWTFHDRASSWRWQRSYTEELITDRGRIIAGFLPQAGKFGWGGGRMNGQVGFGHRRCQVAHLPRLALQQCQHVGPVQPFKDQAGTAIGLHHTMQLWGDTESV